MSLFHNLTLPCFQSLLLLAMILFTHVPLFLIRKKKMKKVAKFWGLLFFYGSPAIILVLSSVLKLVIGTLVFGEMKGNHCACVYYVVVDENLRKNVSGCRRAFYCT